VVEIDTTLAPLHLQLLPQTGASILEGYTLATIAQVTHIEDHQIVFQATQFAFSATAVRTSLELAHQTPTFILQHTEILVVDPQQHLVELLVANVIAETIALTVGAVAEVDLVLARDFDLDVVEEDGLHPPVGFIGFLVGTVSVGFFFIPLVVCADDSVVAFVCRQPVVVIASLESKLFQLLSQTDLSVLKGDALAAEAVIVLVENQVFTLQAQQLTIEATVVHSSTGTHRARAIWFVHEFFDGFLFIFPQQMNVLILVSRFVTEIVVLAVYALLPAFGIETGLNDPDNRSSRTPLLRSQLSLPDPL